MSRPFLHVGIAVFATAVAVVMIAAGLNWLWLLIPLALDLIAAVLIMGPPPKLPEAPRNVRLVRSDGKTVPLELAYYGRDREGVHLWQATAPVYIDTSFEWSVQAEEVPGRTRIVFGMGEER